MTKHEFLAFLNAARDFFGTWPPPPTLYLNLRENTPSGQARLDQQARPLIARMLKRGLLEWIEGAAKLWPELAGLTSRACLACQSSTAAAVPSGAASRIPKTGRP
jgi:hypothetical protein